MKNHKMINDELHNEIIKRSHKRSEKYGVEKNRVFPKKMIQGKEISNNIKKNEKLINIAKDAMYSIEAFLEGSNFFILLTDREGCILNIMGNEEIIEEAKKLDMVVGAYMDEKSIGTNAMGTAIRENISIQISAKEHFITAYHKWTCSAAPIHDEFDNIIGCLNLTGSYTGVHPHTLGLVTVAANYIEKSHKVSIVNERFVEIYEYLDSIIDSIREGIIVIDKNGKIKTINQYACSMFGIRDEFIINKRADDILPHWEKLFITLRNEQKITNKEYSLDGAIKGTFNMDITPIVLNDEVVAMVVLLKEIENVLNIVKKYSGYHARYTFDDIIAQSEEMRVVKEFAKKVALSPSTILIQGESGTGKELMAQSIHNYSAYSDGSFVAVNCGALPKNLIESELFGYEDGAFTGARKGGAPGKFELANGGTIFLDEIGEMPLDMQVKLLRVLQEGNISRVGGTKVIKINTRIIAATNKNLYEEVRKKTFREDLYYRLRVIPINLPSLRERKGDLGLLLRHFLQNKAYKLNKPIPHISDDIKRRIKEYSWPGNIRELENFVENLVNLDGKTSFDIEEQNIYKPKEVEFGNEDVSLEELEKKYIIQCLDKYEYNISKVARILKISRNTLYTKMKKYKIQLNI
ncbi:sigma-54-dependent Fis family transcriptional regulator [Clostridium sp. DL1XJH146]